MHLEFSFRPIHSGRRLACLVFLVAICFQPESHGLWAQASQNSSLLPTNAFTTNAFIIITSDTHLCSDRGRFPQQRERFTRFLNSFSPRMPEHVFVVGDVLDNVDISIPGTPSLGSPSFRAGELPVWHALTNMFPHTAFHGLYGIGHDYSATTDLRELETVQGRSRGALAWNNVWLVWFSIDQGSFSSKTAPYQDAMSADTYAWLEDRLASLPNVILLFHVPLRTETTFDAGRWHDDLNLTLDPRDRLYSLVDRYADKIIAIFNGHIHHGLQTQYAGMPGIQKPHRGIPLFLVPFFNQGHYCLLTMENGQVRIQPRIFQDTGVK